MEHANLLLGIIEMISIIIIGFILRSQIKSQNNLIKNMKQYSDIIDVKKIKDYTESMIELSKTEAKLDAIKYIEAELNTGRYTNLLNGPNEKQCNEFMIFSMFTYLNSDHKFREYLSSKFFKENRKVLDQVARRFDKTS